MTAVLLGDKDLTRAIDRLVTRGSKRAITAGIRAGMVPVARAMRAAVQASTASPELKREAKRSIGARFGKTRKIKQRHAKVGFAVGKRKRAVHSAMRARGKRIAGGKQADRGVGISSANIHWFVLGTDPRQTKAGRFTGQIANVFGDVTRLAYAGSAVAMVEAARAKIWQVIKKEATRRN